MRHKKELKNIAVIPARGGSKRIPGKNLRKFLGRPIIEYSIEAALKSQIFNEVMVSTDDEEIAKMAKALGAKVPFLRSAKASSDTATTMEALYEVLQTYKALGQEFNYLCCIYPTAPFVTPELIQKGFDLLLKENAEACFTAAPYSTPIQRALVHSAAGRAQMLYPEHAKTRSQDLPETFYDAGQFYWLKAQGVKKNTQILLLDSVILPVNPEEVQDIDRESDWKIAELKYQLLQNHKNQAFKG